MVEHAGTGQRSTQDLHRRPERDAARACCIRTSSTSRRGSASRTISADSGFVWRVAYGIFYTPVDLNTWCNQLHNVPLCLSGDEAERQLSFRPSMASTSRPPCLGKTVISFAAFDPHAPPQYVQQWSASLQKSLGSATTIEIGYQGERGFHLQRAHLINNALPGPGLVQPRRPYHVATLCRRHRDSRRTSPLPARPFRSAASTCSRTQHEAGMTRDMSTFGGGIRTGLASGELYVCEEPYNAPDFRSPMFESSIPQNNNDLDAEKGPACDIRHRLALSAVYAIPATKRWNWAEKMTANWQLSTILPGAERISIYSFSVWRYRQRGYASGREPDPRQLYRPAGVWAGYAYGGAMVQYRRIRGSRSLYVRQCGT